MGIHVLTDEDSWFIAKNRVDSLSRSPFSVGDTVVVCGNKHVMLADFYDGVCPTCQSNITVSFIYANVEQGYKLTQADSWFITKNPIDRTSKRRFSVGDTIVICEHNHMTFINSYNGKCPICYSEGRGTIPIRKEFLSWFFPLKLTRELLPKVKIALGVILGFLIASVLILIFTGLISKELFIDYVQKSIFPKTMLLITSFDNFIISNNVNILFEKTSRNIFENNITMLTKMSAVIMIFANGLIFTSSTFGEQIQATYFKTKELVGLFDTRVQTLIETIEKWINGLVNRFI